MNIKQIINNAIAKVIVDNIINNVKFRTGKDKNGDQYVYPIKDEDDKDKKQKPKSKPEEKQEAKKDKKKSAKTNANYLPDKKNAAFAIVEIATGKKAKWLQMSKNNKEELVSRLIEKNYHKLETATLDPSFAEYYPEILQISKDNSNESAHIAEELALRAWDDIRDNNFSDKSDEYFKRIAEEAEYNKKQTEDKINRLKSKISDKKISNLLKDGKKIDDEVLNKAYSTFNEKDYLKFKHNIKRLELIWELQNV